MKKIISIILGIGLGPLFMFTFLFASMLTPIRSYYRTWDSFLISTVVIIFVLILTISFFYRKKNKIFTYSFILSGLLTLIYIIFGVYTYNGPVELNFPNSNCYKC